MMTAEMPSPLGHALAGLAVGFAGLDPNARPDANLLDRPSTFLMASAVVAAMPDLDLLFPVQHRAVTHSVGATLLVMIMTAVVTGQVTGRIGWRWVWGMGLAHASHIVLDWLGVDRFPPLGIEALWPFRHDFYISGWDLFPPTDRRLGEPTMIATNLHAALYEIGIVGPITVMAWLATRRRKTRVLFSVPAVPPPPSGAAADKGGTSDRPAPREAR